MSTKTRSTQAGANSTRMKRRLSLACFLVGVGCLVVSCEPVPHYNRLQVASFAGPPQRKPYGSVKLFQTADDVKRPFEVVGMMSCEGTAAEEAAIVNAMLYRAADMGADGVLLGAPRVGGEEVSGSKVDVRFGWAALLGNSNQRAYRAQAIRFKE